MTFQTVQEKKTLENDYPNLGFELNEGENPQENNFKIAEKLEVSEIVSKVPDLIVGISDTRCKILYNDKKDIELCDNEYSKREFSEAFRYEITGPEQAKIGKKAQELDESENTELASQKDKLVDECYLINGPLETLESDNLNSSRLSFLLNDFEKEARKDLESCNKNSQLSKVEINPKIDKKFVHNQISEAKADSELSKENDNSTDSRSDMSERINNTASPISELSQEENEQKNRDYNFEEIYTNDKINMHENIEETKCDEQSSDKQLYLSNPDSKSNFEESNGTRFINEQADQCTKSFAWGAKHAGNEGPKYICDDYERLKGISAQSNCIDPNQSSNFSPVQNEQKSKNKFYSKLKTDEAKKSGSKYKPKNLSSKPQRNSYAAEMNSLKMLVGSKPMEQTNA